MPAPPADNPYFNQLLPPMSSKAVVMKTAVYFFIGKFAVCFYLIQMLRCCFSMAGERQQADFSVFYNFFFF